MKYLIRKEQVAALNRVLGKMRKARPGEIIGLTEKEMQAWKDKVPYWDSKDTQDIDELLGDVPDPTPKVAKPLASVVSAVIPEKQKRIVIRWMRIDLHKNWSAGEWCDNTPENRERLTSVLAYKRTRDMACGLTYDYKIDEKEAKNDENY